MAIIIENTDDFILALRENEEFQAAARRELLTQDLLDLPKESREFRMRAEKRFDEIEGEVKGARKDIDGLGESFRREARAQSSYRGNYAQRAARGDDLEIAGLFAGQYGLEDIDTRDVSRNTRRTWLRGRRLLIDALNLRSRARRTFLRPDIIAAVVDLYADNDENPEFYIVVESSYTGEEEDVQRATDHAKIVHAATGMDTYPVVAAVVLDDRMDADIRSRLYDDAEELVKADDQNAALWYRLDSADLRPSEPR